MGKMALVSIPKTFAPAAITGQSSATVKSLQHKEKGGDPGGSPPVSFLQLSRRDF
jgi:hypothetical protein